MKLRGGFIIVIAFLAGTVSYAQNLDSVALSRLYPNDLGNLRTRNIGLAFPGMTHTSVMTDTVFLYNTLDRPMRIWFENLPVFIRCKAVPEALPPSGAGIILVTYDAPARQAFGRLVDYFFFMTDDVDKPKKRIIVSPTIMEDFSGLTEEERNNAPIVHLDEKEYNFGTLHEGDTLIHLYKISNQGKRTMIIRGTLPSCGCTKAYPEKTELAPGESTDIVVTFDSRRKHGEQYYTVSVITNDPSNSQLNVTLRGMVEGKAE
jgi:hypothetical protein